MKSTMKDLMNHISKKLYQLMSMKIILKQLGFRLMEYIMTFPFKMIEGIRSQKEFSFLQKKDRGKAIFLIFIYVKEGFCKFMSNILICIFTSFPSNDIISKRKCLHGRM